MKSMIDPSFLRKWLGAALLTSMAAFGVPRTNGALSANELLRRANEPLIAASSVRVSSEDETVVKPAVREAASRVQKLAAARPAAFAAVLRQAYGLRLKPEAQRELVKQAAQGTLPFAGQIVFVPAGDLPGAGAAYARENGGVIFLSAALRTDASALPDLILHEWGHHLDAVLGAGYSPLEAGVIFLQGVNTGAPIPADLLRSSGALEDAHATVQYEGRMVPVECNWFTNAFKSVGNFVVNTGKAAVKTAVSYAKSTVDLVKNAALTVANTTVGIAKGVASGVMLAAGDKAASAELAAGARSSFGDSFTNLKGVGNNLVERVAAMGDLYNSTTKGLDKLVPGLGTAASLAASFTPAGPYLAFAKGVADVKHTVENGGSGWDIAGAVGFAALDVGGTALGRVAGGIKAAKAADFAKLNSLGKYVATRPSANAIGKGLGWMDRLKSSTLATKGAQLEKWVDVKKAATLEKWKYTKASPYEIALGRKLVQEWPITTQGIGYLGYVKKVDIFVRSKDFIPGRDRDKDGNLTGKGGNEWEHHVESVNKIGDAFNPPSAPGDPPVAAAGGGSYTELPPSVTVSGSDLPTVKKKPRRDPNIQVLRRPPRVPPTDDGDDDYPVEPPTEDGDDDRMEDGDGPTRSDDATDENDDATDEGDDATDDGDDAMDENDDATDEGDDATDEGDDATDENDDAMDEGDDATDEGDDGPTRGGDDATDDDATDEGDDGPTRGGDDATDDDDGPTRSTAGDDNDDEVEG